MRVFVVKDRATDQFGVPMFLISVGQVVRSFTDEVNRAAVDNQMYMHPDDFDLYELGSYNQDDAEFDLGSPRIVCRGKDVAVRGGE